MTALLRKLIRDDDGQDRSCASDAGQDHRSPRPGPELRELHHDAAPAPDAAQGQPARESEQEPEREPR